MRNMSALLVLATLALFAVACASSEPADEPTVAPEPTEEPTVAPEATDEPTEEPTQEPAMEPVSVDDIVNIIWQWSDLVETDPAAQSIVPEPENYTIIFRPDGSANLQADCNYLNVSYAVDGSSLAFDMFGPSTLAFCGEDSLDQQFLPLLGQIASFTLEDGRLKLGLADEAGAMGFDNGGPAEEPVLDELPEETAADIVGVTWLWGAYMDQAGENDIDVPNPENFTLTLMPDGTASIQADCNMVSWTYTLEGSSLIFNSLGPSTLAFCGEESLDQQYLALLGNTATYVTVEGNLILNLMADAGNIILSPAAEESVAEVADEIQITNVSWLWLSFADQAEENDINVPNPHDYTLTLRPDGTASIKADCNMVSWTYTLEGNNLTFNTLGPSTLAFCGEESLDQQYLALLGNTATYVNNEGDLILNLGADAGNMVFAAPKLTGAVWQWENVVTPLESFENPSPEQYTVRFGQNDTVNVKADCNMATGAYTADESGFAIDLGPVTLAECGPESLSSEFIQALGAAAIPFFLDGKLYMDLFADSGTLRFGAAAGAAVTGTVTYRQRIALPEDAVVTVQIQDTSRADAPAEVIGEQIIETNGRQVPIPYSVNYNPNAIVENHTYTMSARITDGQGKLLFINDTSIPVITRGNPATDLEIVVVPVG